MAFYKLFCIVHRRTDWGKLYEWQRECIYPEYYRQRREISRKRLSRLIALKSCVDAFFEY